MRGGERVRHEFVLTNLGREAVEIASVKSSCGCVEVGAWPRHLEPEVNGTVSLVFDTASYSGQVSEHVIVTCTDPAQSPLMLRVEATVWWPVEVTPRSARFEFGASSGTNAHQVVRILCHEEGPQTLGVPESTSPSLTATLRTNVPGREFELTVRAVPPLPRGNLFGQVRLRTSSSSMPLLEIPVFAMVQPDVVVEPVELTVPAARPAEVRQQRVMVRSFWTNELVLSSAVVSVPIVKTRLEPVQRGRSYQVELTYPAGFSPSPGQRIELRLESNHPRYRVVRVPIQAESSAAR